MKKISILLLMFVLLFTSTISAYASSEMNIQKAFVTGYTINVLDIADNYEKIEIINNVTGEIEYVESFLDGEQPRYVITTDENEVVITRNESKMLIYQDNVLLQEINIPKVSILPTLSGMSPMDYGEWSPWTTTDVSMSIAGFGVSTLAVAIGLLTGATAGAVAGMAAAAISLGISYIYITFSVRTRIDWSFGIMQEERKIWAYTDYDRQDEFFYVHYTADRPLD